MTNLSHLVLQDTNINMQDARKLVLKFRHLPIKLDMSNNGDYESIDGNDVTNRFDVEFARELKRLSLKEDHSVFDIVIDFCSHGDTKVNYSHSA